jgi:polyadenylation factor subunit 2
MGDEVVHVPISGAVVWTKGQRVVYDGKRMRKPVVRKTVDFNAGIIRNYSDRFFRRDYRDRPFLQPTFDSFKDMEAAYEYSDQPANAFCSRFVHTAVNKSKRPINCVVVCFCELSMF